jgi:hypothetical protein
MGTRALLVAAMVFCAGGGMAAERPGPEKPGLAITIYNANLALVVDVRQIDIARGRQRLELKDVSSDIRPETVTLTGPGLSIVEQNFDYDLLTPQKMMEKAVGQQVQIVRTNPGTGKEVTETATVLSANEGVILKIGDRVEVLRDDGVPTRVIFNGVPENLRAHPTLSVTVDSDRAGPRLVDLSYLTTGLSWKADYVALFDEAAGKLDLQGWITLTNNSGTPFTDAETQLVAGDVAIEGMARPDGPRNRGIQGVIRGGTERRTGPGAAVGVVHIYALPERTTIAENQTKQVSFLDAHGVSARKVYRWSTDEFQSSDNPSSAEVVVAFTNSTAGGLAAGLPAGTVRVYEHDARGSAKFVGENPIGHTPQGSDLAVKIGEAFDVTVKPTLVSSEVVNKRRTRYSMSYRLTNATSARVTVELRQGGLMEQNKVIAESLGGRSIDAYTRGWSVVVPAAGETTLTTELETWW